jgi:hypothetical protein
MSETQTNSAALIIRAGKVRIASRINLSNGGLLAVGGLVSSILVSTATLVWVSTNVARRHPVATGLLHRR